MPLCNRVTPFSTLEANPARGLFTGNRGILHNHLGELVTTRWRHKAWIVCELEFKGMRRKLMQPGHWTELFFLDEATAFAAGHRPCGYCRRPAYRRFLELSGQQSAKQLDAELHPQRIQPQAPTKLSTLPPLTLFAIDSIPFIKLHQNCLQWTHQGYEPAQNFQPSTSVQPLTSPLFRQVLASGYIPVLHPSALIG